MFFFKLSGFKVLLTFPKVLGLNYTGVMRFCDTLKIRLPDCAWHWKRVAMCQAQPEAIKGGLTSAKECGDSPPGAKTNFPKTPYPKIQCCENWMANVGGGGDEKKKTARHRNQH